MLYRAIISEAPLPSALFVLLFVLVLVLSESAQADEEFGLRRLVSNQTLFVSGLPKNFPECKIHPRENSNFL
jgi:sensor domain CHASE-containing protein